MERKAKSTLTEPEIKDELAQALELFRKLNAYYDMHSRRVALLNGNHWQIHTKDSFARYLRSQGVSDKRLEPLYHISPVESVILQLQHEKEVDYIGSMSPK